MVICNSRLPGAICSISSVHEGWVKTHGKPVKDQQVEIVFRKASEPELKPIGQKDYEYYGFVPIGYKLEGEWFRK